jgi:serine/threonine-protein kinase
MKAIQNELPERYVPSAASHTGGMGSVIVAKDTHLDRNVAIKSLSEGVDRKRIFDEIQALQRIRSPHVVQIFDVVVSSEGHIALVEEFLPGDDLSSVELPVKDNLIHTLWQVARALADIHSHGIIHRDIKLNNVKFDAEGVLKIFDFGLSRPDGLEAETRGFRGTQGFAAPELYRSGVVSFSKSVDIYAFGSAACLLSNGVLPKPLREMPPSSPSDNPFSSAAGLNDDLKIALFRCFDPNPEARPTAQELQRLLERELLKDQHRALLVNRQQRHILDADRRTAQLEAKGLGSCKIVYDGFNFVLTKKSGAVSINDVDVTDNHTLPGSCVITLGQEGRGPQRVFVTFDVSHPEVVI